eukprot:jgi/Chlat1/1815/Chrsp135S02131
MEEDEAGMNEDDMEEVEMEDDVEDSSGVVGSSGGDVPAIALRSLGAFEPNGAVSAGPGGTYTLFESLSRARDSNTPSHSSQACEPAEEELYLLASSVTWSADRHVHMRFKLPSTVLQATWATFDGGGVANYLCMLHADAITTYGPDGVLHTLPVPFMPQAMFPLQQGLLVQQTLDGNSTAHAKLPSLTSMAAGASGAVYVLLHPLEDLQPVIMRQEAGRLPEGNISGHNNEVVVWSSLRMSLFMTHSSRLQRHALWRLSLHTASKHSDFEKPVGPVLELQQSEAIAFPVWQETKDYGTGPTSKVMVVHDEDLHEVICYVDTHSILHGVRISTKGNHVLADATGAAFSLKAVDAAAVIASRTFMYDGGHAPRDLLIVYPAGQLLLHVGATKLFGLTIQQAGLSRVIGLRDALQSRVSVVMLDGKVHRVSLASIVPVSPLVRRVLAALVSCLPTTTILNIVQKLLPVADQSSCGREDDVYVSALHAILMSILQDSPAQDVLSRRPMDFDSQQQTPWELLMSSKQHGQLALSNTIKCMPIPPASSAPFSMEPCTASSALVAAPVAEERILAVINALHALFEDMQLDILYSRHLPAMAELLSSLTAAANATHYVDYYQRCLSMPEAALPPQHSPLLQLHTACPRLLLPPPPCLQSYLQSALLYAVKGRVQHKHSQHGSNLQPPKLMPSNAELQLSANVISFYQCLCLKGAEAAVLAMSDARFDWPKLDRLPWAVSLPLRQAIDQQIALEDCREHPPADWPPEAYLFIGREDLSRNHRYFSWCSRAPLPPSYDVRWQPGDASATNPSGEDNVDSNGMEHVCVGKDAHQFGRDMRVRDIRALLQSSLPAPVCTDANPAASDGPDLVARQQARLWRLAARTTALPVGRGAFTLGTWQPLLTEALTVPKLNLSGRLPKQQNAVINLDTHGASVAATDLASWPEFHNGAAAGMQVAASAAGKITRTWIVYNRPREASFAHAGLLMALGLGGHLKVLAATDVYQYLSQEHDATTVGVLLGMAAAKRGTMDAATAKMLFLHIPARHPSSYPELELSPVVQTAAVLSVGLLFQATAHRLMTEIMLAEIGRKPGLEVSADLESYALAAGLALGLTTLGQGRDAIGLADMKIEERLGHYMVGGPEPLHKRPGRDDNTIRFGDLFPGLSQPLRPSDEQNDSGGLVLESPLVNLDVTSPGATLALGLMFMKTNDAAVAERIAIPATHFALDYVRPDFILLRIIARSLVMWDSVRATKQWVQSQVPTFIHATLKQLQANALGDKSIDVEAIAQAHANILAGPGDTDAVALVLAAHRNKSSQCMSTGACFAIGLRYAGTTDAAARDVLCEYFMYFLKQRQPASKVDRVTVETCINIVALSLGVVMAGSGDLTTLKLLRLVAQRLDGVAQGSAGNVANGANYGSHMAASMALGFLFMGGGTKTFSRSNEAIAYLVIALYPRFPQNCSSNRSHLQAFRHLYALATEARCVEARDVDTGQALHVPLELVTSHPRLQASHEETLILSRTTPCPAPDHLQVSRVRVLGPQVWPQDIVMYNGGEVALCSKPLYVKSKIKRLLPEAASCIAVLREGFRPAGAPDGPCSEPTAVQGDITSLCLHSAAVLARERAAQEVDMPVVTTDTQSVLIPIEAPGDVFASLHAALLHEAMTSQRPWKALYYQQFASVVQRFEDASAGNAVHLSSLDVSNIALAITFSQTNTSKAPLVDATFIAAVAVRMKQVYKTLGFASPAGVLSAYYALGCAPDDRVFLRSARLGSGGKQVPVAMLRTLFYTYLVFYQLPSPHEAAFAIAAAKQHNTCTAAILAHHLPTTPHAAILEIARCLQAQL